MSRRFCAVLLSMLSTLGVALAAGTMCAAADSSAAQYAKLIAAEPDLAAYWPFDGDLKDAQGKADGTPLKGEPQFAEGPGGRRALALDAGRYVTMGPTPHLDLEETTVELWVQPNFKPGVSYNPCIIAKRADGDHRNTRFSIHFWNDYSCLAVWDGRQVVKFVAGAGPLEQDQWYHLAVTASAQGMQLYLDGVPCDADPAGGNFNFAQQKLPLSIGSSQPKGAEILACRVDEAAIYSRALSADEVARHVDAMGFQDRRLRLVAARQERIELEKRLRAEREARRKLWLADFLADPALTARGQQTVYRGEHLAAIRLTLGGIGSGGIQINGQAEREIWQIFNNHRHATLPHSFFAVRVKSGDGEPVVRALQTTAVGPFAAMTSLSFRGEYPFAWYDFEDPDVPVRIGLEAFNPLVPLEARSSAIPCAVFNLTAENPTDDSLDVSFLATQQNAVGYLADKPITGRTYPGYGGNRNAIVRDAETVVLHMTADQPRTGAGYGDMALMALAGDATAAASWENLDELRGAFAASGALAGPQSSAPSTAGETVDGALAVGFRLAPGQRRTVSFVLTWHFPNGPHGSRGWGGSGNRYADWWPDAMAVARELQRELPDLSRKTRLYHDSLYESNLPYWLLDRISSQVAVLRSQTCYWTVAGYFGGWEGCSPEQGCCHGNCNHVWHYAQAHARLFPSIARLMRQQEFQSQAADGAIPHRQPESFPAFDGQCGAVLNSYREHTMCPDRRWLDEHWPKIKQATDYLITRWDADEDGVLAGAQWNTLDGALAGSSSWLGTLYLAALSAAERMANLAGEPDAAQRYGRIRDAGCKEQDETLFSGEYYVQIPEPTPHEDYANGCHIDQVLGQWWAHQLDLGWLYPRERVRSALASLIEHNFRGDFHGIRQAPRVFVAPDDPGMQMIVWPDGQRPAKVIRYGDEVMTGFEYSAAAAMVQAGMLREGLAVVRAVSIRYDGRLRTGLSPGGYSSWGYSGNPFGDDECGKYYARALSVWSMLLACQGYVGEGSAGRIGFRPVWRPEDHRSFFTAPEGWGVFSQRREDHTQTEQIEVRYGRLPVGQMVFQLPEKTTPTEVTAQLGGQDVAIRIDGVRGDSVVELVLKAPVVVEPGRRLEVVLLTE